MTPPYILSNRGGSEEKKKSEKLKQRLRGVVGKEHNRNQAKNDREGGVEEKENE